MMKLKPMLVVRVSGKLELQIALRYRKRLIG